MADSHTLLTRTSVMDSYYPEKTGYEQSRHNTALTLSRSMRSLNQHELSDHSSGGMSPSTEMEGKLRNSQQRRRVPVAVSYFFYQLISTWIFLSNKLNSVAGAGKGRSSAAATLAMAKDAPTVGVPVIMTASS